jgi:Exonuclease III
VLILTEAKDSNGCNYIKDYFKSHGFWVYYPKFIEGDYGTFIITKFPFKKGIFENTFKSTRVASIQLLNHLNNLEILGIYVPNNKQKGKEIFIKKIMDFLRQHNPKNSFLLCGDLNLIEPNHLPKYSKFEEWEYQFYDNLILSQLFDAFRLHNPNKIEHSWVGRTGDGYRYDHCFVSKDIIPLISDCYYNHDPRIKKLSDHSCLITIIKTD